VALVHVAVAPATIGAAGRCLCLTAAQNVASLASGASSHRHSLTSSLVAFDNQTAPHLAITSQTTQPDPPRAREMPQHIELAMPVDSLDGVYAVGAALLAGAMFIVLLWRLTSKPPTRPRPAKPRCYRVREIPMSTTEGELRDLIATHHLGAADLRLTLARSSPTYCMATLLSSDRPKIEAMGYPVDSDFLGITPLFGGGDAAVE